MAPGIKPSNSCSTDLSALLTDLDFPHNAAKQNKRYGLFIQKLKVRSFWQLLCLEKFALGMFSKLEKYKTGDLINTCQYPSLTKSSTFSSLTKLIKSQRGLMDWCHQMKKYCMHILSRPYFCQTVSHPLLLRMSK